MADTRKDKRAPISLKVRFKSATLDEFMEQYSHDISRGGIFIKSKNPMSVGTLLKFEFQLKDESRVIHGVGRVVWQREATDDHPPGMGIKFIKMDPESRSLVDETVQRRGNAPGRFEEGADPKPKSSGGFFPSTTPEDELPLPEDRTQVRHASEFLASALAGGAAGSSAREAEKKAEEARKRTEEIERKRAETKKKRKPRIKKTLVGMGIPTEDPGDPAKLAAAVKALEAKAEADKAEAEKAAADEAAADETAEPKAAEPKADETSSAESAPPPATDEGESSADEASAAAEADDSPEESAERDEGAAADEQAAEQSTDASDGADDGDEAAAAAAASAEDDEAATSETASEEATDAAPAAASASDDTSSDEAPADEEPSEPAPAPVAAAPAAKAPKTASAKPKPSAEPSARPAAAATPPAEEEESNTLMLVGFALLTLLAIGAIIYLERQPSAEEAEQPRPAPAPVTAVEEPTVEEPTIEEPAVEEPVVEEVAIDDEIPAEEMVATASVDVTSTPEGASLFVNGEAAGSTPGSVTLPIGEAATITARLAGYTEASQEVTAAEGENEAIGFTLEAMSYVIVVAVTPDNARVRGGGAVMQDGEIALDAAPTEALELRGTARGFEGGSVTVSPGAFSEVDGRMVANVTLALEATPEPAARPSRPRRGRSSGTSGSRATTESAAPAPAPQEATPTEAPAPEATEPAPEPSSDPAPQPQEEEPHAPPDNPFG